MSVFDLTSMVLDNQVQEFVIQYYFVPGFQNIYCVGSDGGVWSRYAYLGYGRWVIGNDWKKLVLTPDRDGYLCVKLCLNGVRKTCKVHQIVANVFLGLCPLGLEVCHGDGNPQNNHVYNLRYDTKQNNSQDQIKHGTDSRGDRNGMAVLSQDIVDQIREEYDTKKYTQRQLSEKHGVSQGRICLIVRYETWFSDDPTKDNYRGKVKDFNYHDHGGERNPNALLSWDLVGQIREEWATGKYTQAQLGKKYGVSPLTIGRIVRYERWIPADSTNI